MFKRDRFITLSLTLACLSSLTVSPVQAQITPDNSLGDESSVMTPNVTVKDRSADLIEGGAIRDSSLFHSFSEFNVGDGNAVYFASPKGINNILTRVTGNNISNVFGTLGVDGTANLFLLNPNGIIFGENAILDVNGSFFATTAESYIFDNNLAYSATNPDAPNLLTVNIPLGIQLGNDSGDITVLGSGHNLAFNPFDSSTIRSFRNPGLQTSTDSTLALLGGDINITGGNLTSEAGRIELGSVDESGLVLIMPTDNGLILEYGNIDNFGDISFTQAASLDVSGSGNGDLQIQGGNLSLIGASAILANTSGSDNGSDIIISAADSLELIGVKFNEQTPFSTTIVNEVEATATGNGGNLIINTESLLVTGNAKISSSNFGEGNSGNIIFHANNIKLSENAQVASIAFSTGNSGNISVTAQEIEIADSPNSITNSPSGFSTDVISILPNPFFPGTSATGNAGNIDIETDNLTIGNGGIVASSVRGDGDGGDTNIIVTNNLQILDGGQIGTGTFSSGNSGNLNVTAKKIEIANLLDEAVNNSSGLFTDVISIPPNQFFSGTEATGKGGNLNITTESLQVGRQGAVSSSVRGEGDGGNLTIVTNTLEVLNGGQIGSGTFAAGNAGELTVAATESIKIDGYDLISDRRFNNRPNVFPSGLFASVEPGGTGNGGNLTVETTDLQLSNGGNIAANTSGMGNAGDITIDAGNIKVRDIVTSLSNTNSGITSSVEQIGIADGGDIKISANNLSLLEGGTIAVDAKGQGNAGNITLDAQNISVTGTSSGEIIGDIPQQQLPATISAFAGGDYDAGNIIINSNTLKVSDRANISVSNLGNGNSGNLNITSSKLDLDNSATIEAKVNAGSQGNINLVTDNIFLNNQSEVTAVASGMAQGGNININNTENIVLLNDSQIIADAIQGNGGNIDIMTQGYFVSADSLVSASSEFGLDGDVEVETINGDRQIELGKLPENTIRANEQITASCKISANQFAISGKGGLPNNPTQNLRGQAVWQDTRIPAIANATNSVLKSKSTSDQSIIEATNWHFNQSGKIELVAITNNHTVSNLGRSDRCQADKIKP